MFVLSAGSRALSQREPPQSFFDGPVSRPLVPFSSRTFSPLNPPSPFCSSSVSFSPYPLSLSRRSRNTAATRLLCDKKKRRKLVCPLAEYHTHGVGAPSLAHARFRISSSSFSLFIFFFCFLLVFSRSIQCAINEFDTGSYSGQTPLFTLVQSTYAFQENNGQ